MDAKQAPERGRGELDWSGLTCHFNPSTEFTPEMRSGSLPLFKHTSSPLNANRHLGRSKKLTKNTVPLATNTKRCPC